MSKENHEKEEWRGWKIVSDMLDNPDECGIYPTSKCYQKLYDFVVMQRSKAREELLADMLKNCNKEENEGGRLLVEWYRKTLF